MHTHIYTYYTRAFKLARASSTAQMKLTLPLLLLLLLLLLLTLTLTGVHAVVSMSRTQRGYFFCVKVYWEHGAVGAAGAL